MNTLEYAIELVFLVIFGCTMFVLGIRHGVKKLGNMILEDQEKEYREHKQNRYEYVKGKFEGHSRSRRYEPKRLEEYTIENLRDAEKVLASLVELAERYDAVSLADYYDTIRAPSQFSDNAYGWDLNGISQARVVRVRSGYVIKFPKIIRLGESLDKIDPVYKSAEASRITAETTITGGVIDDSTNH